ncbi:uncharacterized protein LOC111452283 isoform X1 [Cucurbita moschata]|uniref:Uncharacterized protein LOC111452283 isoform X1 n=1 Tax=Cucurbita moschata TaxID=3662 RepID=A0A6J1GAK8_CUCMO|nr:uncharacterized protein LOC111452283 isoform X1 [Cucurbita moschata]
MSSILSSQGLVIATAMVVSSTALFLAFSKHHKITPTPSKSLLRSCLSSDDKKREKNKNKNKKKGKKVRFAEDVKEPRGNGEEYRKEHDEKMAMAERRRRTTSTTTRSCKNQTPANQLALYNGILKQRSQRIQCSF